MLTILGITGPIFILIGVGFAAVRSGLMARADMRALGVFVIHFALPALLFKSMSQRAVDDLVSGRLLVVYTVGSLLAAGGVLAIARLGRKADPQSAAIQAMGSSISNSAFIGYPIALQVFGPTASAGLAAYAPIEAAIMMPLMLTLADAAGGGGGGRWISVLGGILRRLAKNPFILSIAAGIGWSALGLQMPLPLARAVDMLSAASAPVALFCIGGTLAGIRIQGLLGDISLIVAGKLLLHPLCVFLVFLLLPLTDHRLQTTAILNAAMPMMSIYPLFGQKYGHENVCAAALVAATVSSFFTISAFLWLAGTG